MNSIALSGRLTRDPEINGGDSPYCRFTIAVKRDFVREEQVDFIDCTARRRSDANFLFNFAHKGDLIGVTGQLRADSYEKDGQKRTRTFVNVNRLEILAKKKADQPEREESQTRNGGFDPESEPLPFY